MLNQLSNLTAGLYATSGIIEELAPFDVAECLSSLSGFDDDLTLALDQLDALTEHYDVTTPATKQDIRIDELLMIANFTYLIAELRGLSRMVKADLMAKGGLVYE